MRSLKELQDKIKEVKQNRDKAEKPLHDAINSVVLVKNAHIHDIERICYAPERAKTFEQFVHRTAGHKAQDAQLGKDKDNLHVARISAEQTYKVNEERLQAEKKLKESEYGRHNGDHKILRGVERARGILKPEHLELLVAEMRKIASAEVATWLSQ